MCILFSFYPLVITLLLLRNKKKLAEKNRVKIR